MKMNKNSNLKDLSYREATSDELKFLSSAIHVINLRTISILFVAFLLSGMVTYGCISDINIISLHIKDIIVPALAIIVPQCIAWYVIWKACYIKHCLRKSLIKVVNCTCTERYIHTDSSPDGNNSYYVYSVTTEKGNIRTIKNPQVYNGTLNENDKFLLISFGDKTFAFVVL